ncbi:MAG: helix-turn-helix domain-containing protein [Desulfobulbaceae bacterium]|nr:helix-turn-helix domain-containing protein [Desulfobulbaceae bacterium]
MRDENRDFAARVKSLRKGKGLTQVDIAASMGVAKSTIGNYESGYSLPQTIDLFKAYAKALGTTVGYLIDGDICHAGQRIPVDLTNIEDIAALRREIESLKAEVARLEKESLELYRENKRLSAGTAQMGKPPPEHTART